ncbi:DUF2178 domain-containing protein [Haloplanus halophilus]|uniref:DUF2178 domain-containing protein n=1 Tax=Haloplanus halophilus TaxID=2949993 RepID=UPI00203F7558|nr:DUF2178 domain-containing protein [Haloplanus sp. GDY1]
MIGVGILGLLVGMVIDRYLAGTVVYLLGAWIGGGIAFAAPRVSDSRLQDERDYELHNRASGLAMGITMALGIGIVPPLYVLDAGGYVELTGAAGGGILVASALFLLYGFCFGLVQRGA